MQSDRRKLWLDLWKQLEESTPARPPHSGLGSRRGSAAPSVMRVAPVQTALGVSCNPGNENNLVLLNNLTRGYLAASKYAVEKVMAPEATAQQDPRDARWRTFVQNDTITGILIGVWDNVTGPRVEHAWVNAKEDSKLMKDQEKQRINELKRKEKEEKEKEKEATKELNNNNNNKTEPTKIVNDDDDDGDDGTKKDEETEEKIIETDTKQEQQEERNIDDNEEKEKEKEKEEEEEEEDDEDEEEEEASDTSQQFLHEIAKDTLAGTLEDSFVVKFVVLPHNGSVICSISFTAPYGHDMASTKLSFTLYAKRSKLERIVAIYRLVEDKLMYLALVARALYARCPQYAVDRLHDEVCRAIWLLDSAAKLPGFTPIAADRFGAELSAAATVFGEPFLARAVTSHLSTRGYSVVVAPDQATLRVMTNILATFLDPRDLALSLPCVERYCPGLVLQGIVGTLESAGIDEDQLLQAPLPTTVIDLSSPQITVRHPDGHKTFNSERKNYFQHTISVLASKGVPGEEPLFPNVRVAPATPATPKFNPLVGSAGNGAMNANGNGNVGGLGMGVVEVPGRREPLASPLAAAAAAAAGRKGTSLAGNSVPSVSALGKMPPSKQNMLTVADLPLVKKQEPRMPVVNGNESGSNGSNGGNGKNREKEVKKEKEKEKEKEVKENVGFDTLKGCSIYTDVKDSSKLVDDIIAQALRLPLHLRQAFVKHSCTLLTYKAVSYLKMFASDR